MLLRSKDRKALMDIFSSVSARFEVWAYGSRVSGQAHEGSDLDLVVRSNNGQKLPSAVFTELKEKIRQSNIPILVELFDWAKLPDSFRKNIEANHEPLFSNLAMGVNEPPVVYTRKEEGESEEE